MSNRTVPAAAEGLSKANLSADNLSKLESLIDTARMSAHVANYLLGEMLGGEAVGDTVRTTEWKREILVFATGRAASDAEEANAAFLNAVYVGREL